VTGAVAAVDGVSFAVRRGECFGLVGESGSGKTTLARAVLGLVPVTAGRVSLDGEAAGGAGGAAGRGFRRRVQIVFQDPYGALDPRWTVREAVHEPLAVHGLARGPADAEARVVTLLREVGLDPELLDRLPHELSGGQRQRVGLARALAVEPELLVLDEAVSALDVTVQAQVLDLLLELQARRGLAYLFISHDLAVVRHLAHRVAVMQRGRFVELGDTAEVFDRPAHAYTRSLVECARGERL
jgi:ABC-type glutathione transport system ATPase component